MEQPYPVLFLEKMGKSSNIVYTSSNRAPVLVPSIWTVFIYVTNLFEFIVKYYHTLPNLLFIK